MVAQHVRQFLEFVRNPQRQLFIVIAIITYCFLVVTWQYRTVEYTDPVQPVLEVHPRVFNLASQVQVGMHINNFPEFSFRENAFTIDALVWFSFPVGTESLHTLKKFSFQNGRIIRRSLPTIKIINNQVTVSFQTIVKLKAHLDYTNFPMSDHRLNIVLENRNVTPNELCFTSSPDNFAIADEKMLTSSWRPGDKTVEAGYIKALLSTQDTSLETNYPCVAFTLEFANTSIRDLISLYFPLFILFFLGFFSLLIDIRKDTLRTTVLVTSMPSLALFRLVIDQITPPASNITRIDLLYYTLVCLALMLVLFQVYSLLVLRKANNGTREPSEEKRIRYLELLNSSLFLIISAALVGMISYIHVL